MDQATLELGDGLNILQAPNEAGKSTWCAFLSAMFYGVNSRERDRGDTIAEKNRYAPWNGAPMQGRLDCTDDTGREVTLMRATVRAGAPMGAFRALYTGTGDPVPELTGSNCGDQLLGIPREVFERSAFIRQNGLSITAHPELERRIAALISTGEEGTSYTEATEALKRQQNRRRYSTRGEIPAAEAQLAAIQDKLLQLERSRAEATQLEAELAQLEQRRADTAQQLEAWKLFRSAQSRAQLAESKEQAQQAQAEAELLRHRLQTQRIPENETIGRLRGALIHLETARKGLDKARDQRDEALKAQLKAEAALNESPFAGQTPESARRDATRAARPYTPDGKPSSLPPSPPH